FHLFELDVHQERSLSRSGPQARPRRVAGVDRRAAVAWVLEEQDGHQEIRRLELRGGGSEAHEVIARSNEPQPAMLGSASRGADLPNIGIESHGRNAVSIGTQSSTL